MGEKVLLHQFSWSFDELFVATIILFFKMFKYLFTIIQQVDCWNVFWMIKKHFCLFTCDLYDTQRNCEFLFFAGIGLAITC